MKKKLLACICSILFFAMLAACDTDPGGTKSSNVSQSPDDGTQKPAAPAIDWTKVTVYSPEESDMVLGTATAEIVGTSGRYKETVMGNFIMDGIAEYASFITGKKVDFALHNGQNLKAPYAGTPYSLPAGEIKNSAILGLLGTDKLFICTYTGKQVKDIIEVLVNSNTHSTWSANCVVIVSKEVKYNITPDADDPTKPPHATNIRVNNAAIKDTKDYRVALGDFIGNNTNTSRSFPVLEDSKKVDQSPTTLAQAVAMYVLAKGTIKPSDYPLGRYPGEVPSLAP